MCEPQVFGLQAVSGRAKFSLYGWADSGLGLIYMECRHDLPTYVSFLVHTYHHIK